jgi:hypothetical protein
MGTFFTNLIAGRRTGAVQTAAPALFAIRRLFNGFPDRREPVFSTQLVRTHTPAIDSVFSRVLESVHGKKSSGMKGGHPSNPAAVLARTAHGGASGDAAPTRAPGGENFDPNVATHLDPPTSRRLDK